MAESTFDRGAESRSVPTMLLLGAEDAPRLAGRVDEWIARWSDAGAPEVAGTFPSTSRPPDEGPARLAIVGVTRRRLELARKVVAQDVPWRGRNSVWFEPRGLLGDGGLLAFVFPGVEPTFEPRIDDVARHFGLPVTATSQGGEPQTPMSDLEGQARSIIAVGRLLHRALDELGTVPDMVAGHSVGEWNGELASGVVSEAFIDEFLDQLRPGRIEVADVVAYLAIGCDVQQAAEMISDVDHTVISHDNCPNQSVVCGPPHEIAVVANRCRVRGLLAQEMPFRSGFHSPLFTRHLAAFRTAVDSLPLQAPSVPLWSATTCRPYPSDPRQIRELTERHLLEPVRFRELTLALHEAGARVFVQVGAGSLTSFIDDTLTGRAAATVAANTPRRSGLEQLGHVAAALWVEGRAVSFDRLASPGGAAARVPGKGDVAAPPKAHEPGHGSRSDALARRRRFALDVEPSWIDHAIVHQREDWPYPEDRFPLVPMAGIVDILMDAASDLRPGLIPVAIESTTAIRYLVVEPPTTTNVRATAAGTEPDGSARVNVAIDGHAWATVLMAPTYPTEPPPSAATQLADERPNHIEADRLYTDRHLFHGPAYRGIEEILTLAGNGSRALLRVPAAPGALLDNAGQLMAHWLSSHADVNRMMLPTSIGRVELFGPHPRAGALVDCTMTVTHLDDSALRADMELLVDGRPWCLITGWEDRRFATDRLVFEALLWPEQTALAKDRGSYALVRERWHDSATRDLISRCYLGRDERHDYDRRHPLDQRQFLLGRIATKDAVRHWLWSHGHESIYPAEIAVAEDPTGRPVVRGPYRDDLRVSLAHVEAAGVAAVANDESVGIDIEKVEPRRPDFEHLALTPREQQLDPPDDYDRDSWLTCLWTAKEAAAKATGHGLRGRPKDFEVTELHNGARGRCCRVGDLWIAFNLIDIEAASGDSSSGDSRKEHIVAWTLTDR